VTQTAVSWACDLTCFDLVVQKSNMVAPLVPVASVVLCRSVLIVIRKLERLLVVLISNGRSLADECRTQS
jgi:hypothetical protein